MQGCRVLSGVQSRRRPSGLCREVKVGAGMQALALAYGTRLEVFQRLTLFLPEIHTFLCQSRLMRGIIRQVQAGKEGKETVGKSWDDSLWLCQPLHAHCSELRTQLPSPVVPTHSLLHCLPAPLPSLSSFLPFPMC